MKQYSTFHALICAILTGTLSACTTSHEALSKNPKAVGEAALCRSFITTKDEAFRQELYRELSHRSIAPMQCAEMVKKQNQAIAAGIAIAAVGAAVAICANNDCGGGGGGYYSGGYAQGADWDAFYNQYGQIVWACREVASGQFTYDHNCFGQSKTDWRWPGK